MFSPVIPDQLKVSYDTVNISEGSSTSPAVAKPLVSRTPGSMYGTNELNLWSRIRGAAGRFVKSVLVPTGKAALLTLMNPSTGKAAQICYNSLSDNGGSTTSPAPTVWCGYSRLNLSNLAENVRSKLSKALGGDVT